MFTGSEEDRISLLKYCIELGAEYVDIEDSTEEKTIQELIDQDSTKVIVSNHNFTDSNNLMDTYKRLQKYKTIIKIAATANNILDNLKIFKLLDTAKKENQPIIAHCMGEYGEISRILNVSVGSVLTYGYLHKPIARGQLKCDILKRVYRVSKINKNTKIYGLVGNPVSKSVGYLIHNLAFKEYDIDAVYLNFLVDNLKKFIDSYKYLIQGLSVTMPYKKDIINFVDEQDEPVKKIGAANTLIKLNNNLLAYNTDVIGATIAIESTTNLDNKKVLVLGAGGVARAIIYGLKQKGSIVTIHNRTKKTAEELAKVFDCKAIDNFNLRDYDILINTTSVGMYPKINDCPVEGKIPKNLIVFDTIYNPITTKLMRKSRKNIQGIEMFINQGIEQFKLWTRVTPDKNYFENTVMENVIW